MSTLSQYAATVNRGSVAVPSVADVANATSGSTITPTASSFATLLTAGANGTKVEEIDVVGTGTTLAGLIRIYIFNGTSYFLWDTVIVAAIVPSATQQNFRQSTPYPNLELKSGDSLVVSSTVASQLCNVIAEGGDY